MAEERWGLPEEWPDCLRLENRPESPFKRSKRLMRELFGKSARRERVVNAGFRNPETRGATNGKAWGH